MSQANKELYEFDKFRLDVGESGFADLLLTPGRLNSGEEITYAFGLDSRRYNGRKTIEHNGGMLGFTVDMVRFPEDRLTVIVLGNTLDRYATDLAYEVADIYLGRPSIQLSATQPGTAISLAKENLNNFAGYYWNRELNHYRRATVTGNELVLDWGEGTPREPLLPIGGGRFLRHQKERTGRDEADQFISFQPQSDGGMRMAIEVAGSSRKQFFGRYNPTPPASLNEVKPYTGSYYSRELGVTYTFKIVNGKFTFRIANGKEIELFPKSTPRVVWNAKNMVWIGFGEITFLRGEGGQITRFEIGDGRVNHVSFQKISG